MTSAAGRARGTLGVWGISKLDQALLWVVVVALVMVVGAPLAFGVWEGRQRRRERALATRRKTKLRL